MTYCSDSRWNTSVFAGLCRSDPPVYRRLLFLLKATSFLQPHLLEFFLLLLIQFGSFYIIGQFIQPYLRDWYGHQRERPCIRTEVEIVWNIIPSGSVALSVIKRGENVMNESHFHLFQPQFIDSFHCILISSQPSSVSWTYAQLTSSPVGLSWIEGWVRSSQRSGFYSLSIFKSFSSPG